MQKYKSYKPSGLDLFQEFPSHWKLSRMKNVGKVNQGLQIPISKRLLKKEKGSEPYITVRKINSPNSTQYYIKGANRSVRCDEEDILIARTGATGQIISNVKGVFHNNFFVFRYNQKKFSKNFILYYLSAESLRSYLLMLAGTTTIPDLNHNNFYSIPFLKLPLKEQISIANYLNSKTKLIDKKIKLLQEKIDLYKEYKKSVVNDTVLNGLKDDISHWNNKRLKDVGKLYSGLSGKSGNDFNQDENPNNKGFIPFTNIANNTYLDKNHLGTVIIEKNENQNRVKKGDIFFLMSSEGYEDIGKSAVLLDDIDEVYLNSFCKGFRLKNKNCEPSFINYVLSSDYYRQKMIVEGKGFTRINLKMEKVNNFEIHIPPNKEEQVEIAEFLDSKTETIDKIVGNIKKQIKTLKELRKTLINDVVTGKIKVTG